MGKGQTKCPICGRFVSKGLADKYENIKNECELLTKSNKYMEEQISNLQDEVIGVTAKYEDLQREYEHLKNRGFWERVFNK